MITLIHGDHTEASRQVLFELKSRDPSLEVITVDAKNPDSNRLIQALESNSLFGSQKLVIIERLFSNLNARSKNYHNLIQIISNSPSDVVIWEGKQLTPAQIKSFGPKIRNLEFMHSKYIFGLLDGLKPGNVAGLVRLYEQTLTTTAPELIFAMLVKRIGQLIVICEGGQPEGMAGWQLSRLTTQANLFTMEKLRNMYKHLLEIDYSIKSGNCAISYEDQLVLFFASL